MFKLWLLELDFIFLSVINIFGIIYVGYIGNADKKYRNWSNWCNENEVILTQDTLYVSFLGWLDLDLFSHSSSSPEGCHVKESWTWHQQAPWEDRASTSSFLSSLRCISKTVFLFISKNVCFSAQDTNRY